MGRITSYPIVMSLNNDDVVIVDGSSGTRTIDAGRLSDDMLERQCRSTVFSKNVRRSLYIPRNLGTTFTSQQNAALAGDAPTFADMYPGCYWTINERMYRIADIDYWYNKGDKVKSPTVTDTEAENPHHIVLIPMFTIDNIRMNDTDTTDGGYLNSKAYTEYLNPLREIIETDWADHVFVHRETFTNAVTNGVPSAHVWADSKIDLVNMNMVCGHPAFRTVSSGTNLINHDDYTIDKDQLAIFRNCPTTRHNGLNIYGLTRDVASGTSFAAISGYGQVTTYSATYQFRPIVVFGIKAT